MNMAGNTLLVKDRKFQNFVCALQALVLTGKCLETFTKECLKSVHDKILQKIGRSMPACTKQCSKQINDHTKWCNTCKTWQREFPAYQRNQRANLRNWKCFHSWLWPRNSTNLAEIFLQPNWITNLQDLSTICTIWSNCSEFGNHLKLKSEVMKKYRNDLTHCAVMSISDEYKETIYKDIKDLFNEPDIAPTLAEQYKELLKIVDTPLENTLFEDVEQHKIEIREILNTVLKNKSETEKVLNKVYSINEKVDKLTEKKKKKPSPFIWKLFTFFALPSLVLCCVTIGTWNIIGITSRDQRHGQGYTDSGCLEERDVNGDLSTDHYSMIYYVLKHKRLIGREWLFKRLENCLLSPGNMSRGVIMFAEMGYGKSAIMAHTVCANQPDPGYVIRKHLVAYHLCRFDVALSKQPGTFIKRLLDMFVIRFPSVITFLQHDGTCIKHYLTTKESCDRDVIGCLENCLLFPLNDLHVKNRIFVILIDALDECFDTITDRNGIADILKYKIFSFPRWIKFIISARNVTELLSFGDDFNIINLSSHDSENIEDAKMYLNSKSTSETLVEKQNATWNFLFLSLVLEQEYPATTYLSSGKNPTELNRIYEYNFDRVFKRDYKVAARMFNILISSFSPLTERTLIEISISQGNIQGEVIKNEFMKMKPFLVVINECIHFNHMSLPLWLLHEDTRYQLSAADGHTIIANYLCNVLRTKTESVDPVDLVIHISKSSSHVSLEGKLKSLDTEQVRDRSLRTEEPHLHRLVSRIDDFHATRLLLNHFPDANILNEDGNTAMYISASLGHLQTLKALIDHGADINFRRQGIPNVIELYRAVDIGFHFQQWDFGILDIASQKNRVDIVKLLLQHDTYNFNKTNGLNLFPIHLACRFGHTSVVKIISNKFNWMPDEQCLYYAAEHGFTELAIFLLDFGVKDKCQWCAEDMFWISNSSTRIQGSGNRADSYVLYDDWKFINCETALHAAVQWNQTSIVRLLISRNQSAINCLDRGGNSPLFLAVKYGFEEIAKLLLTNYGYGAKDICKPYPFITELSQLNEDEIANLRNSYCITGQSLIHIAVRYNREWYHSLKNTSDMRLRDEFGCNPIHYAVCHRNVHRLETLKRLYGSEIFNLTCNNGSLPVHIAAQYGAYINVRTIIQQSWSNICAIDNLNRSIAMYAVSRYIAEDVADDSESTNLDSELITQLVNTFKEIIEMEDSNKRNIFHYAIANGHYSVVSELMNKYRKTSLMLLQIKDVFGKTPIRHALKRFNIAHQFIYNMTDIITSTCFSPVRRHQLTSHEYSLFYVFYTFPTVYCNNKSSDAILIMTTLIKKMRFNLFFSFFSFYKCCKPNVTYEEYGTLLELLLQHDPSGIAPFHFLLTEYYSWLNNDDLAIIRTFTLCRGHKEFSLIHFIARNFDILFKVRQDRGVFEKLIIDTYFKRVDGELIHCKDNEGFTIIDRAIQGGNKQLVKYLFDKGFRPSQSIYNTLLMSMKTAKSSIQYNFKYFINNSIEDLDVDKVVYLRKAYDRVNEHATENIFRHKSTVIEYDPSFDEMTSFLIDEFHTSLKPYHVCSPNAGNLSLVHLLAIQNLKMSLNSMVHYFGEAILTCSNRDHFTPLYLANMFEAGHVVNYLETRVESKLPVEYAQQNLLFRISSDFGLHKNKLEECFFQNNMFRLHNIPKGFRILRCLRKTFRLLNVNANDFPECLKIIKLSLIFLSNANAMTERKIPVIDKALSVKGQSTALSLQIGNSELPPMYFSIRELISAIPYLKMNMYNSYATFARHVCRLARLTHIELMKKVHTKLIGLTPASTFEKYLLTEKLNDIELLLELAKMVSPEYYCIEVSDVCVKAQIEKLLRRESVCSFSSIKMLIFAYYLELKSVPYSNYFVTELASSNWSDTTWWNHYFRYQYLNSISTLSKYDNMFVKKDLSLKEALIRISRKNDKKTAAFLEALFEKHRQKFAERHDE